MKQVKKGSTVATTKKSLSDFKNKFNLNNTVNADKEIQFIPMGKAFTEAIKLPGIPMGYGTLVSGWSNTGKSTLKNTLIANCQKMGIIPVIYDTEQNFNFQYAKDCGMQYKEVYGEILNEDTGELENKLVGYEGDFIYFDNVMLAKQYGNMDYSTGKTNDKNWRNTPVIEDIARSITELLEYQEKGEITQPLCFIWDSVGSIGSYKSLVSKTGNNMFDAGAISTAFNTIVNQKIPASRRVDYPYTNTYLFVNKIWNDSMNSMGNAASIKLKGGESLYFAARLIIHLGGTAKAATKKLQATAKGQMYTYGTISKIKVTKNQLPTPYTTTGEGEVACVHNGLIVPDNADKYKKEHMSTIVERLSEAANIAINESDIRFSESEEFEMD